MVILNIIMIFFRYKLSDDYGATGDATFDTTCNEFGQWDPPPLICKGRSTSY